MYHPAGIGTDKRSGSNALCARCGAFFLSVRVSDTLLLAVNDCKATRFSESRGQRRDRQQDQAGKEDSHFNSSHVKKVR
jgi:hypothetical protein